MADSRFEFRQPIPDLGLLNTNIDNQRSCKTFCGSLNASRFCYLISTLTLSNESYFCSWDEWSTQRPCNMPKVPCLVNGKVEWCQRLCFHCDALFSLPRHFKHLARLQNTSAKNLLELHLVGFKLYFYFLKSWKAI